MAKNNKKETTFAKTKENENKMRSNIVRFDWAIKNIMRDKANYDILEGFLSTLLGKTIKIKNLTESESNKPNEKSKCTRVDVLAEDENNELMLFEFQNADQPDFFQRITYGISRTIAEHLDAGEPYDRIRKVYAISIVYFNLGEGDGYLYHGHMQFDNVNDPDDRLLLSENQQIQYKCEKPDDLMPECYIIKVKQFGSEIHNYMDEWIHFLKTDEAANDTKAPGLLEAKKRLSISMLSPEDRARYLNDMEDLSYEKSMLKGAEAKGEVKGRNKAILEIAKNFKDIGISIEKIKQATGLPEDVIEGL